MCLASVPRRPPPSPSGAADVGRVGPGIRPLFDNMNCSALGVRVIGGICR